MNRRSFLVRTAIAAGSLSFFGCTTPSRTAQALFGRWEGGNTVVIFTPNGLYSIYRGGSRAEGGIYGVPHSKEILVSQAVGRYSLRNLWQIQKLDSDHLELVFPDGKSMDFTRAKAKKPLEPQLVGLWQTPSGDTDWNFYDLTAEGNYIQVLWWGDKVNGFRRVVSQGVVRVETNRLYFTNFHAEFRFYEFTVAKRSLHLVNAEIPVDVVYTQTDSAKSLERD